MTDKAIQIGFPADANDDELEAAEGSGAFTDLNSFCAVSSLTAVAAVTTRTTEMSVFFACVRLRQITSVIHTTFQEKRIVGHDKNHITARGAVYAKLDELLRELQGWRKSAPVFENPSCLYEMQEWYDLLCLRERLILARKALDLVPKQNNTPPKDLVVLCLHCAVGAITIFCQLFQSKKITFTRSYFQMLYTGGLSIMFCLSVIKEHDLETIREAISAITHGQTALKQMGEEMPDAKRYVAVYEALRDNVLRKCNRRSQGCFSSMILEPLHSTMHDPNYHGPSMSSSSFPTEQFPPSHDSALFGMSGSFNSGHESVSQYPNAEINPSISDGSTFSWGLFNEDALWNMEAGLNEYAYGDPPATLYSDDPFDIHMFQ
ncbi:uncharacterized protein N7511_006778 [Penicillium nucicola]|uniref:uncharacterized protein n=1 Tax=Penicillium nucicola TaxID=1850975 RepID=UPI002544EF9A|nr:uncharacterized protein N7511_006778 [Penicillium nucicola]KAJ5758084.1 hypothetical protein N7511_006778 [Penicillium nucicola]